MKLLRPVVAGSKQSLLVANWRSNPPRRMIRRPRFAFPASLILSSKPENPAITSTCSPLTAITSELGDDLVESSSTGPNELEEQIEKAIYRCRFLAVLGVSGSLVGSILCFLKGCVYVVNSFMDYFASGGNVVLILFEAIDIYLIGMVMLVFGMGLYELFISNLDIAKTSSYGSNLLGLFALKERPKWLEIQSLNELKTKLGHVIVMVLLVGMFEKSKKVAISSPRDLLCFAASILLSSCSLYLLSMLDNSKTIKHT